MSEKLAARLPDEFGIGGDWDAVTHTTFLRATGAGMAGYTADMIERIYAALIAERANGDQLALAKECIALLEEDQARNEAEIASLRTLLARSLVFDGGSAEDAAEALGGLPQVFALAAEYRAAHDGGPQ